MHRKKAEMKTDHPASFFFNRRLTLKHANFTLMKQLLTIGSFLILSASAWAQLTPEITSWVINTTNATGYNNIPSNVQTVQYSATQVYVSCTCIPGYSIGPWIGNPNTASNQNF